MTVVIAILGAMQLVCWGTLGALLLAELLEYFFA